MNIWRMENNKNEVLYLNMPNTKETDWYIGDYMVSEASIRTVEAWFRSTLTKMTKEEKKSLRRSLKRLEIHWLDLANKEDYNEDW